MASPLELAFRRAAERLLNRERGFVVAVSGGADSMALLHLTLRWYGVRRERLVVAHLDHGLRRGSVADRRFVERAARAAGVEVVAERRDVPALRRRDESPEEAARRVRRAFLESVRDRHGLDGILTGHTVEDQAETVLMRLARGAGPEALAGIAERSGAYVRPLLELEREALRSWLTGRGIDWREDPTNRERLYDRNRVRLDVVPLIERALNPRAGRHIASAAASLRADARYLNELAESSFDALAIEGRAGLPALDRPALRALPDVIGKRVAHLALRRAGVDPRRISRRHVDALLALANGPGNRASDLPGRLRAVAGPRRIRFEKR